jgi:hypothetical protein
MPMSAGDGKPYTERPPWWVSALVLGTIGLVAWLVLGWAGHWTVAIPVLLFVAGFLGMFA